MTPNPTDNSGPPSGRALEPAGIGGWLVALLLFELGGLLSGVVAVRVCFRQAGFAASIDYVGFILAFAWLALAAAILMAMFRRSRFFIRLWKVQAAFYIASVAMSAVGYALAPTGDPLDQMALGGSLVGVVAALLTWRYLKVSRRVRNTFGATAYPAPATSERFLKWLAVGFAMESFAASRDIAIGTGTFVDAFVQCAMIGLVAAGVAMFIVTLFRFRAS